MDSEFEIKVKRKNWEIDDKVFEITNIFGGEDNEGKPRMPSKSLMASKVNTSINMSQEVHIKCSRVIQGKRG
jgi:hypothetical protein